jgi:serine/threonine protein phosphatase PrpC
MMANSNSRYAPRVGLRSQEGGRGRSNDDSCDFFVVERADLPGKIYIAVVADGVTGTAGGAQASRIAVETVKAILQEAPGRQETLSEWLESAILRANEEIIFEAKKNPQWQGMSTTIVVAALAGDRLYVMHLGDSRAYLVRDGDIHQLVADHTWAQEAIATGVITVEEAATHPGRNQLLRYLGAHKGVALDRGIIAPETNRRDEYLIVQDGDAILVCTDGLHNLVREDEIQQIILEHAGYPQEAVDALIEKALAKGERDDITAVLMELPPARKERTQPLAAATRAATVVEERPTRTWTPFIFWLWGAVILAFLAWYLLHMI